MVSSRSFCGQLEQGPLCTAQAALRTEVSELLALSASLADFAPDLSPTISDWSRDLRQMWQAGGTPFLMEQQLEQFARALRQHWLQYAAAVPGAVYRSPTDKQQKAMAKDPRIEGFGYERDLQPEILEHRCTAFFEPPPPPWQAQHLLFSSGQAAMTAALLVLQQQLCPRKTSVVHLGKYFETRLLMEALPATIDLLGPAQVLDADCLIVEPIACDGRFSRVDVKELGAQMAVHRSAPRCVIFDSTLLGRVDEVNCFLARTCSVGPNIIMRVCSGLKLFQAGLEIANVGILTCFKRADLLQPTDDVSAALRVLRTLTGGGLRAADTLALEAPWIFDRDNTARYEQAIFDHNAALAAAVAADNRLFEPLSHPALEGASAPYCVFRLVCPTSEAYDALEGKIIDEAKRHKLNFDKGGSFGFRGHRFEVVYPDTGEQPFLRVALGRRGGWSCNGIIKMMATLASRGG